MKTHRRRGVLVLVLVIMFAVVTLIMALFQVTSVTLQESLRTETDLEAQQAVKFKLLEVMKQQKIDPACAPVLALTTSSDERFATNLTASQLFNATTAPTGLPSYHKPQTLSVDPQVQGFAGHRYFRFDTKGAGGKAQYLATTAYTAPYALMTASNDTQAISVTGLYPWTNPLWGQAKEPLTSTGNLDFAPIKVLCAGGAAIGSFPCGEVYADAAIGVGVPFRISNLTNKAVPVNPKLVASRLRPSLNLAQQRILDTCQNCDKTILLTDSNEIQDGLGLFFSQLALPNKYHDQLSVNQSQGFWLPTIPGFANQFDILYHLIFNIPDRPDGGLNGVSDLAHDVMETFLDAMKYLFWVSDQLESAKEAVQSAQNTVDSLHCNAWNGLWCYPAKYAAEAVLEAAILALDVVEGLYDTAISAVMVICSPITDAMTAALAASGQMPIPNTRNIEANYKSLYNCTLDKNGMDAWAYRSVFNSLTSAFSDLFSGQFQKLAQDFGRPVNVVFFGQKDKKQFDGQEQSLWKFGSVLNIPATLNVPSGRAFYLSRSTTINGDLWLGRGSSMAVVGNLTLQAGSSPSGDSGHAPSGRIYLEEGATLAVTGTLTTAGDHNSGSVVVAGGLSKLYPTTSAIFCGGQFVAPHGIFPGVSPDEMTHFIGNNPTAPEIIPVSSSFWPQMLSQIAPNLAKIDGPFNRRLPYIARFSTTFEFIDLGEIAFPFVCPQVWPNIHVRVFRGLSNIYAATLNFELGENFLTHTDWWGNKGEGRVPIFIKPDAATIAEQGALNSGSWSPNVLPPTSSAIGARLEQIAPDDIDKFSNSLCLQLAAMWATMISTETGIPLLSYGDLISDILNQINQFYNVDDIATEMDNLISTDSLKGLTDQTSSFWSAVNGSQTGVLTSLTQECPGVLIYAHGSINIGQPEATARLASGWFISEMDINCNCDTTVGALTCMSNGKIVAKDVLYYPNFTRASLRLPVTEGEGWRGRGQNMQYGSSISDTRSPKDQAIDIGFPERVTAISKRVNR